MVSLCFSHADAAFAAAAAAPPPPPLALGFDDVPWLPELDGRDESFALVGLVEEWALGVAMLRAQVAAIEETIRAHEAQIQPAESQQK